MKSTIKIIIRLAIYLTIYAFLLLSINCARANTLTQIVKGKLLVKESESPLEFANVVVLGKTPHTITEPKGKLFIELTFLSYKVDF